MTIITVVLSRLGTVNFPSKYQDRILFLYAVKAQENKVKLTTRLYELLQKYTTEKRNDLFDCIEVNFFPKILQAEKLGNELHRLYVARYFNCHFRGSHFRGSHGRNLETTTFSKQKRYYHVMKCNVRGYNCTSLKFVFAVFLERTLAYYIINFREDCLQILNDSVLKEFKGLLEL